MSMRPIFAKSGRPAFTVSITPLIIPSIAPTMAPLSESNTPRNVSPQSSVVMPETMPPVKPARKAEPASKTVLNASAQLISTMVSAISLIMFTVN